MLIKTLVLSFLFLFSQSVFAKTEISLLTGYRTGGDLENVNTGTNVTFEETSSYSLLIGKDYGPVHVMEFLYSHQNTDLYDKSTIPFNKIFNVDIDYYHMGGSQIWSDKSSDKFFGAGLGAVHISPNGVTYSGTTRFSMNLNGGIVFKLSENIGLRLGVIAYFSAFGSNDTICAGNQCTVVGSGFMRQYEANAGLRFRF